MDLKLTESTESERALLAAALIKDGVIDDAGEYLKPSDFKNEQYGQLWALMLKIRADGKKAKPAVLKAEGANADIIAEVQPSVASALGFESYAQRIRIASERRQIMRACLTIATMVEEVPEHDGFQTEVFDMLINSFKEDQAKTETVTLREGAEIALRNAIEAMRNGGDVSGLSTGFGELDRRTTGLHPGDLVILAGRPGMGKTTFALNVAYDVSERGAVAFFSLEMPADQLAGKILSTEGNIGSQDLQRGQIGGKVDRLTDVMASFSKRDFYIYDKPGIGLGYMRSKLHQIKAKTGSGPALIVVDYLQLMRGDRSGNREQEVSGLSRGLKILARDFECPVIVLAQLNRAAESRADHRPMLSDLRESGAIEQDADMVWFAYREAYYNDAADPEAAELIISKQRRGPLGTVDLRFLGRFSKFMEPTPATQERYTWSV